MPQPKKTKSSRNKGAEQPIRIAVKLNDRAPKGLNELGGLEKYLDEKSGHSGRTLRLLPLIESVDPKRLGELIDKAWRSDPQVELPHFSAWYQIICPPGIHPDELAKALRELDTVETAYVMRPGPPPVNPGDDPRNTERHRRPVRVGLRRGRRRRNRICRYGAGLEPEPRRLGCRRHHAPFGH
jgi:hypothetical protein